MNQERDWEWEKRAAGAFPESKVWREGDELVGRIAEIKTATVQGKQREVAIIEEQSGRCWSVWLTYSLQVLKELPLFTLVKIVYRTERKLKQGRRVKNFDVFVAKESKPEPW